MKHRIILIILQCVILTFAYGKKDVVEPSFACDAGYVNESLALAVRLRESSPVNTPEREFRYKSLIRNAPCVKIGITIDGSDDSWLIVRGGFLYMFPTDVIFEPMDSSPKSTLFDVNRLQSFQVSNTCLLRMPLVPLGSPIRLKLIAGAGAGVGILHFMDKMIDEATPFAHIFPVVGGELLLFNKISLVNEYSYHWGISITQQDTYDTATSSVNREVRYFTQSFRVNFGMNVYL